MFILCYAEISVIEYKVVPNKWKAPLSLSNPLYTISGGAVMVSSNREGDKLWDCLTWKQSASAVAGGCLGNLFTLLRNSYLNPRNVQLAVGECDDNFMLVYSIHLIADHSSMRTDLRVIVIDPRLCGL